MCLRSHRCSSAHTSPPRVLPPFCSAPLRPALPLPFPAAQYDNCNNENILPMLRYPPMHKALNATGWPIYFSLCEVRDRRSGGEARGAHMRRPVCICMPCGSNSLHLHSCLRSRLLLLGCQWGDDVPYLWAPSLGNSWRTTTDIGDTWHEMVRNIFQNDAGAKVAGRGQWNDPDMLEVGNGGMTTGTVRIPPIRTRICKTIGTYLDAYIAVVTPCPPHPLACFVWQ
jgi:hypothetical protein